MINFDEMIEVVKVKEGKEFVEGWYNDKKPVFGYKLRAKKGSLLDKVEIKSKAKFKLENDSENYVQEVRIILDDVIKKYYELHNCEDDNEVAKWVHKVVDRRLINLARGLKGGNSYYDAEKEEYIINQIEYFEDYCDESILEYHINNIKESTINNSKTEFLQWFEDNKHNILTKKQLDYLSNEIVGLKNEKRLHRNIVKRVDKAYHDNSILENRKKKLIFKLNCVQDLLDCYDLKELKSLIIDMDSIDECYFVIDEIYKGLEFKDCKKITSVLKDECEIDKDLYYKLFNILINLEKKLKDNEILQKC